MDKANSSVLIIDDEENLTVTLTRGLKKEGFFVRAFTDPEMAIQAVKNESPHVIITDIVMPNMDGLELIERVRRVVPEINFVIMTAHASLDTAIQALRLGVIDYLVKPFRIKELVAATQKAVSQNRFLPTSGGQDALRNRYQLKNLISQDPKMREIFALVTRISPMDSTVLITGESGTGKEMIARAIHYNSKRKDMPFVSVNCAALPETLLESELFGHEKGSFTGADATKPGLFEVADHGTFFLDEIGEMPASLQAKLLRVLQERTVKRVGGLRDIPIDIRLVAATSRNLQQEIQTGGFREDLFYRLHVVPIALPPLRNRAVDLPALAKHFLDFYRQRHEIQRNFQLSPDAIHELGSHHWPGNIRELENLMERIVTTAESDLVTGDHLKRMMTPREVTPSGTGSKRLSEAVTEFERRLIVEALQKSNYNKSRAAKALGITHQNLDYKLKKYGIHGKSTEDEPNPS